MGRRREAPTGNRHRITDLGAEPIHKPAEAQQADPVSDLEGGVNHAILLIGPAYLVVESVFEQRKNLPVNVVDRGRKEEQRAYHPAKIAEPVAAEGRRGWFGLRQISARRVLHRSESESSGGT
jgi:hypothetical protein